MPDPAHHNDVHHRKRLLRRLIIVLPCMFLFGYALMPIYKSFCKVTGLNVLALNERANSPEDDARRARNTQVDYSRTINVEFDANTTGIWHFHPAVNHLNVNPGVIQTVYYEFENAQPRKMKAQAIPSYAPAQAMRFFNKLECFCFRQYTLNPGEKRIWPVVFFIDPKLPKSIHNITLSYSFFEVGGAIVHAPT